MKEDILIYSPTVMFRGTPCSFLQDISVRRTDETLLTISKLYGLGFVIIKRY